MCAAPLRAGYFCAARDPIGICSLYWGRGADGSVWFASEMKALQSRCETIDIFPPVGPGGMAALRRKGAPLVAGAAQARESAFCSAVGFDWKPDQLAGLGAARTRQHRPRLLLAACL